MSDNPTDDDICRCSLILATMIDGIQEQVDAEGLSNGHRDRLFMAQCVEAVKMAEAAGKPGVRFLLGRTLVGLLTTEREEHLTSLFAAAATDRVERAAEGE